MAEELLAEETTRLIVTELAGTRAGAVVASYLPPWASDVGKILLGSAALYGLQQIPLSGNDRMKSMTSQHTYTIGSGGSRGSKAPRLDEPVYDLPPTQPIPISLLPPEYHDLDPNGDPWIHPVPDKGNHF